MRLYTDEELKEIFGDSDDDNESEFLCGDIPVVKESKIKRIKNWFSSKVNNVKFERKAENLEKDIPVVKESKIIKLSNKISSIRKNIKLKKEIKTQSQNQKSYKKLSLIKSFGTCLIEATVSCVSFAGALVAASSALTIGFLPAIAIATGFVAASKISNYLFKNEIAEFKKIKNSYDLNNKKEEKVESDELIEEKNTVNKKEKSEQTKNSINNLVVTTNNIENVKLTREQKIAKVKEECKLGYVKNLNTYFVFTPKENVKLQKFITNEYKKQYPTEKIQSFVTEDNKILILSQRPILK